MMDRNNDFLRSILWIIILCIAIPSVGYAGSFKEQIGSKTWNEIVAEARGQSVNWHMWSENMTIVRWVDGYLKNRLAEEHGVNLIRVPLKDVKKTVEKLRTERRNGVFANGSIDLIWINGENFRMLKQGKMLFQFADKLPNMQYVNKEHPSIKLDFGYPGEDYESPYGGAQFVFNFDSAKVPQPPESMGALLDWIKKHPGKFTYPEPPHFTGSVFIRHVFYHVAGGYENLKGPFDEELFDTYAPKLWIKLQEIKPYLWNKGKVFPKNKADLDQLVHRGEVYFGMGYAPIRSANLIANGIYPNTMKTLVFEEGTICNTHYVAIPFNAKNKAGAMILANLILDPATQFEKMKPEVWGDQPILDFTKLPKEWQQKFMNFPRHPSTLSREELVSHQLPELQSDWVLNIEEGWLNNIKDR